jgi:hypothetical protein
MAIPEFIFSNISDFDDYMYVCTVYYMTIACPLAACGDSIRPWSYISITQKIFRVSYSNLFSHILSACVNYVYKVLHLAQLRGNKAISSLAITQVVDH